MDVWPVCGQDLKLLPCLSTCPIYTLEGMLMHFEVMFCVHVSYIYLCMYICIVIVVLFVRQSFYIYFGKKSIFRKYI